MALCILDDKEYPMTPYLVREDGRKVANVIRFPKMAGDLNIADGE